MDPYQVRFVFASSDHEWALDEPLGGESHTMYEVLQRLFLFQSVLTILNSIIIYHSNHMSIFLEIVIYLNFYDLFYHFLSIDIQWIWHISTSNGRACYSKIKYDILFTWSIVSRQIWNNKLNMLVINWIVIFWYEHQFQ